jgi:hypothetical protein
MEHLRGMGRHGHLHVIRRHIDCNLVFSGKVTGQVPDFHATVIGKDKIPVVILKVETGVDV